MKSNVIGSIYYSLDERTYQLTGDLFTKELQEGGYCIVFDNGDYVTKVYKTGFTNPIKYQQAVDEMLRRNSIECYEPVSYIGSVKHLLGEIYHPVFKQKKLQLLSYDNRYDLDFTMKMIEAGWEPRLYIFRRGNDEIYDLHKENFGIDENGNLKLIDCEIEKASV